MMDWKERSQGQTIECEVARALWISGSFPMVIGNFPGSSMIEFVEHLMVDIPVSLRNAFLVHMACVFEEIWRLRNGIMFKGGQPNLTTSTMRIRKNFGEYMCHSEREVLSPSTPNHFPCGLGRDTELVLITDAAWSAGMAGLAAVLINLRDGSWRFKVQLAGAESALEGETKAIWMAISWIKHRTDASIGIASDCLIAIQALSNGKCVPDWKFFNISLAILDLVKSFKACNFSFVKRSNLFFVDGLAKSVRVSTLAVGDYVGEGIPPVVPNLFSQ
ncbi:hypothetical protein CsatA_011414 [Cannabis sativa]